MSRCLLALILTLAGSGAAGARDALGAINGCLPQLDAGLDVGYERIAARCPDLAASLQSSPWAAWLPRDWNRTGNELSAGGLTELRTALTRVPRPLGPAPRLERLGAALAALTPAEPPRRSWWARFRDWLRELLAPSAARAEENWWQRLFGGLSLPRSAVELIIWSALALLIALAATIVVNELRVAGILSRWRARRPRAAAAGARQSRPALQELSRANPAQQPRLLLELIAVRLGELDRLPPARALTVQELARAARLAPPERERLSELGMACERVRFSDRALAPAVLAGALARGRALLAALEAATLPAQAAD
jgi:hypothetical protein